MVHTARHRVPTKGQRDAHDITAQVTAAVSASGQRSGVATVFVVGSTAAITTIAIPFIDGALVLGTWQQVLLLECDTRARTRDVVIQVVGD